MDTRYSNCQECPFSKKEHAGANYYNINCCDSDTTRRCASYVKPTDEVIPPLWCTKSKTSGWYGLTPQIPWNKIQVGGKYHIPPTSTNKERYNITISAVTNNWFSYYKEGSTVLEFMYPNYLSYKVMTQQKGKWHPKM